MRRRFNDEPPERLLYQLNLNRALAITKRVEFATPVVSDKCAHAQQTGNVGSRPHERLEMLSELARRFWPRHRAHDVVKRDYHSISRCDHSSEPRYLDDQYAPVPIDCKLYHRCLSVLGGSPRDVPGSCVLPLPTRTNTDKRVYYIVAHGDDYRLAGPTTGRGAGVVFWLSLAG